MNYRQLVGCAIAAFSFLIQPAKAQNPEQLLRGILNATRQGQQQSAPSQYPPPSTGMVASPPPMQLPPGSILWSNKQAFLDATRSGALADVYRATREEKAKLAASVAHILYTEFQVPPIPQDCRRFEDDVSTLLGNIAEANIVSLSDRGPDFVNPNGNGRYHSGIIDNRVSELQASSGDFCDQRAMGRSSPHPYKAALVNLAREYAEATKQYVSAERDRRKAVYAQAQQAEIERQQTVRAAEQQRIDAEAARVRAEEQRRTQKERARLGG